MPFPNIENFKILRKIGSKICYTLYDASDRRDGKRVFLKVLDEKLSDNEKIVHNFLNGARITKILDNPQICKTYDFGSSSGNFFIASEPIESEPLRLLSLETFIWSSEEPSEGLLDIFIKIGLTLRYTHLRGVAHGFLNPDCIYVASDGSIKIDDFGFYWFIPYLLQKSDAETVHLSHFISPEAYEEIDKIDGRSDIYSLNVILFRLITGQFPYKDSKFSAIQSALLSESVPSLREYEPHFPIGLDKVISKSLNRNPENRFQNLKELVDDLALIKNELSGTHEKADDINRVYNLSQILSTAQNVIFKNKYVISGLGILILTVAIGLAAFNSRIPLLNKTDSQKVNDVSSPVAEKQTVLSKIDKPQLTRRELPTMFKEDTTNSVLGKVNTKEPAISEQPELEDADIVGKLPPSYEKSIEKQPSAPDRIVASITVQSKNKPLVANVSVNGQFRGKTDKQGKIRISDLELNRYYEIKVSKKGYLTASKGFKAAKKNPVLSINLWPTLDIFGTLILDPVPKADSILVDGRLYKGKPPLKIRIAAGKHRIRLVNSNLNASWEKEVNLQIGQEIRISHDFQKVEYGSVAISLKNAAEFGFGYVYVDGKLWEENPNTTPLNMNLPVGSHTISVRREGFVSTPKDKTVIVDKGVTKYFSFVFSKIE